MTARRKYQKGEEWKRTLEPWARLYARAYRQMNRHLEKMTDAQLAELAAAMTMPTQTNCGWDAYGAAEFIRGEVRWEIEMRRKASMRWDVVRDDGVVIIAATTTADARDKAEWLNQRARGRREYTLTQVA